MKSMKKKEAECQERYQQEEIDKLEEAFISQEEENISILNSTFDENTLNTSLSRSGRVCSTKKSSDISAQTDHKFNAPKIRINSKVCTDQVKSTCASVSTKCEVSVEVARLAVKTVKKGMYDHDVYLNTEEQSAAEHSKPPDNDQNEPPSKKKRTVPVPSSKADYDKYQYVLPSAQTVSDYKHMQASEAEGNAAIARYQKPDNVKRIMHYDTTSRSSVDGEWPSRILKLSSGQEYRLRPLFFAYEDREQITNLFIETYKHLSLILYAINNKLSSPITPAALWHKTDTLMTDAVTKNLKIEDNIATALGTTYKPMHRYVKATRLKH